MQENNHITPRRILGTTIAIILIGTLFLFFTSGDSWVLARDFRGTLDILLFWINGIIIAVALYAIYRTVDIFLLKTSPSEQEKTRQLYIQILVAITLILGIALVLFILIDIYSIWQKESLSSPFDIIVIAVKLVLGFFVKIFFTLYNFFLEFVKEALGKVNMTVKFLDKEVTIGDNDTIDQIVTVAVMFVLFQRRTLIISTFTYTRDFIRWTKGVLIGNNPEVLQKGLLGMLNKIFSKVYAFGLTLLGFKRKPETSRGSANFADKSEAHKLINKKNTGLLVDEERCLNENTTDRHMLVLAPTGQGKTTNYVIPNILHTKAGEQTSFVITDPKGDIHAATSGYLNSIGFDVRIIDLTNPEQSRMFNPLQRTKDANGKISDKQIARIADIIIDCKTVGQGNSNPFFNNAAKMLLTTLIKVLARMDERYYNLHNLAYLVSLMGNAGEGILPLVMTYTDNYDADENLVVTDRAEQEKNERLLQEYLSFISKNEETISSVIMTAQVALKDLAIEELQMLTAHDNIAFEDLREKNVALFIITPPSETEFFKFYLTLLYSQLFTYCEASAARLTKEQKERINRVYFLMDEFGNLGKIPSFQQVITTLRSAKCSVSIILQDIEQVKMIYGAEGASAIINGGCASKLVFGAIQNKNTLQEVSLLMGNKTIKEKRGTRGDENLIGRPLMTPDEINRMSLGSALLLSAGHRPIKLQLTQWSANKRFNGIEKLAPVTEPIREIKIEYIPHGSEQNQQVINAAMYILKKNKQKAKGEL